MTLEQRRDRLEAACQTCRLGHPFRLFAEISSTNDVLKGLALADMPEGYTVMAEAQSAGRGRMGRQWLSPRGQGVYLSVLLRPRWPAYEAPLIGMVTALAVRDAVEAVGVRGGQVKWPNDVLVAGRKIAGILVEPRIGDTDMDFCVVGIGVNVRQTAAELAAVTDRPATSCGREGVSTDCDAVAVMVVRALDGWYDRALRGERGPIKEAWMRCCAPPAESALASLERSE